MTFQDETLVTHFIQQYRNQLLQRERERLKKIKTQFYELVDTIPFNEEA